MTAGQVHGRSWGRWAKHTYAWFFIPALLTAAHLLWISLDTGAFGGDQSVYGFATLELFNSLIHSPGEWPRLMMHVFPWKANGLIWAGQFFLPFAYLTSSVDKALLLTIWTMQLITLIMIYRALSDLETGETAAPILGCLVVASAPLFVSLGQHYLVETSQTLSVAWFVVLMCVAPKMTRPQILAQLIAASSFALLTKVSQPLFCVWPGVVACGYFIWPRRTDANSLGSRYTLFSFTIAILLSAATVAWYVQNITPVMQLAREAAYGRSASVYWGKVDTYVNTAVFWLNAALTDLFVSRFGMVVLAVVAWATVHRLRNPHSRAQHFSLCAGAAALQIASVVLVFSLSSTRQDRYFLPALPYVAVLVSWSVVEIGNLPIKALAVSAFLIQFALVSGQALDLISGISGLIRPFDSNARNSLVMAEIVSRTCSADTKGISWNVIAVDPGIPAIQGDWLAPEPANYGAAKARFWKGGSLPCHYAYLGDGFFGAPLKTSWERVLSHETRFMVTTDPANYPPPSLAFNESLSTENFPGLLNLIREGGVFEPEAPLAQDRGILVFHRAR